MADTKIEWCKKSWNPISGCIPISEGCEHCYARRMAHRLKGRYGYPYDEPFRVTFHPDKLDEPLKWKKPSRIFVCSMGDLFHDDVNQTLLDHVFGIISRSVFGPYPHEFLILTKRPENMKQYVDLILSKSSFGWPWPHVWIGVTAENQKRADERIPILLEIPAKVKFVSIEPMLSSIDISPYIWTNGRLYDSTATNSSPKKQKGSIHLVIVGGETGPGARWMDPDWARSVRDDCQEAGISFFMKQMSGKEPIPEDLMIREWSNEI